MYTRNPIYTAKRYPWSRLSNHWRFESLQLPHSSFKIKLGMKSNHQQTRELTNSSLWGLTINIEITNSEDTVINNTYIDPTQPYLFHHIDNSHGGFKTITVFIYYSQQVPYTILSKPKPEDKVLSSIPSHSNLNNFFNYNSEVKASYHFNYKTNNIITYRSKRNQPSSKLTYFSGIFNKLSETNETEEANYNNRSQNENYNPVDPIILGNFLSKYPDFKEIPETDPNERSDKLRVSVLNSISHFNNYRRVPMQPIINGSFDHWKSCHDTSTQLGLYDFAELCLFFASAIMETDDFIPFSTLCFLSPNGAAAFKMLQSRIQEEY